VKRLLTVLLLISANWASAAAAAAHFTNNPVVSVIACQVYSPEPQ